MSKAIEKITAKLEAIRDDLEQMSNDAQDTYDNRSEKWQESERGEEWQEKIDALDDATSSVQDAIDYLSDIE